MVAELGFRDGMTPPPDLPTGDCILTSLHDDHGQPTGIRIDHADPRVLISAELLDIMAVDPAPGVTLDTSRCCECFRENDYTEAVLTIHGANRTVIYRITGYEPSVHGYIAEWPD